MTPHGDLDLIASLGLAAVLRDLIDGQGNLALVVDLRDVHRIDGSGVEVLAAAAARIAGRGGELRLSGPSGTVPEVLAAAGLVRLDSTPFEQAQRPWSLGGRSAGGARARAASVKNFHPAGRGYPRHDQGETP